MNKKTMNLVIVISIAVVVVVSVLLAVLLTNNTAKEYTYKTDDFLIVKKGDDVSIKKYIGKSESEIYELPSTVEGFTINKIAPSAFKGNKTIKKVIIPSSIKTIGKEAFLGCTSLNTVDMQGVVTIEMDAFKDCNSLDTINMPVSLVTIGAGAFKNTSSLRRFSYNYTDKYVVKSNLKNIGKEAFRGSRLEDIIIPESMKTIGEGAFKGAKLENIIFFDGVEEIKREAFMNAYYNTCDVYTFDKSKTYTDDPSENFESYIEILRRHLSNKDAMPSTLKRIGDKAFATEKDKDYSSSGRVDIYNITFPKSLVSIGDYAFKGANMSNIKFASPDTKLGKYAFSSVYPSSRLDIELPANIKVIPEGLFFKTTLYDNFTLPKMVETVEVAAFSGSTKRYSVKFDDTSPAFNKYEFLMSTNFSGLVSKDRKILYSVIMYSSDAVVEIPSTIEVIEKGAFTGVARHNVNTTLHELNINSNIKTIKAGAFSDSNLTLLNFNMDSVANLDISKDAFTPIDEDYEYTLRVRTVEIRDTLKAMFNTGKVQVFVMA